MLDSPEEENFQYIVLGAVLFLYDSHRMYEANTLLEILKFPASLLKEKTVYKEQQRAAYRYRRPPDSQMEEEESEIPYFMQNNVAPVVPSNMELSSQLPPIVPLDEDADLHSKVEYLPLEEFEEPSPEKVRKMNARSYYISKDLRLCLAYSKAEIMDGFRKLVEMLDIEVDGIVQLFRSRVLRSVFKRSQAAASRLFELVVEECTEVAE